VAAGEPIERADRNTLLLIRSVAVGGQTVALGLTIKAPEQPLPLIALGLISLAFVVATLLVQERIRRKSVADDAAFFRQILIDIAILTYLLCVSGGPDNPFHNMYVLPVTIAAASLPARLVWGTAAAVFACYVFLELVHLPLPLDHPLVEALVRFGELSDHVLLAILVSYFVLRMSKGLRERDRQLAEAHEREIRAGCAIALGSVAAGAAHELTTPLSTISTVVGELRAERSQRPDLVRNLELLQASLSACLMCLRDLRASGEAWLKGGEAISADRFLDEVANRFRDLRPGAHVAKIYDGELPGPRIIPDLAVQQAIVNLLSNAASVSPLDITLTSSWDARDLVVRVCDKGPGISPELATRLGRVFVTTKPPDAGNGIGLFLTNVTITRLGGHLRLFNAADGGAVAEICVPLASLQKRERFNEQFA
jgi:two-component system sensor histidine kinase RegB